jgi:urease accessory protein
MASYWCANRLKNCRWRSDIFYFEDEMMNKDSLARANKVVPASDIKAKQAKDNLVLAYDDRHTRREVRVTESGRRFLIDLERAVVLCEGDALELEDGSLVRVRAAAESLLKIQAKDSEALLRAAWHIGNRHTPLEVTKDALYITADHVLADMLKAHGCEVTSVQRPFNPERGAYDVPESGHSHGHHHHDH